MTSVSHSPTAGTPFGARLDPDWLDVALSALAEMAASVDAFSNSDLREAGVPAPAHASHWGALWVVANARGICSPVGVVLSRTPSRHRGAQRLWASGVAA